MNFYDVMIYNDELNGICNKVTYHSYKADDKDKARRFGNRESRRLFKGNRTSVHVVWVEYAKVDPPER